jgi:UDP-N-acetylmuramoylalanine--D-glutamate ligase
MLDITYDIPNLNINGHFETSFKLSGYYTENSIAASAAALAYGLDDTAIIKGLNSIKGIAGHMEYIGNFKGREVHFDAAFVPEGLVKTLESFQNEELIVIVDNPDSTNPRDKYKVGEVVGKYAKVLICSGYNETTKKYNIEAANEVVQGAQKSSAIKIPVEDMVTAGELSIKHSHSGCTILHVGPGAITNYEDVKTKMMSGIMEGCKKYD